MTMKKYLLFILLVLFISGEIFADNLKPIVDRGLTNVDGTLQLEGEIYRGIGVNYFDVFSRFMANPNDKSYIKGLDVLASYEIPFIRFSLTGYWPNDLELVIKDREKFYQLFDEFLLHAQRLNIALIPSFFWNHMAVADYFNEPVSSWGNENSKTRNFMRNFTKEFVGRYKDRDIIWAWEFGNEINLHSDIPLSKGWDRRVKVKKGTPALRTRKDILKYHQVKSALIDYSEVVRSLDKFRLISSGTSMPRPYTFNMRHKNNRAIDTKSEFVQSLIEDAPGFIDVYSVHIYPDKYREYFSVSGSSTDTLIKLAHHASLKNKKILFIGEFGVSRKMGERSMDMFRSFLTLILEQKIFLSAVWVFDYDWQNSTYNIPLVLSERSRQLDMIREYNKQFKLLN